MTNNQNDEITGDLKKQCGEYNKKFKLRSIEDLGISKDNNDPPTPSLTEMLDEYVETYNKFEEIIMRSVIEQ